MTAELEPPSDATKSWRVRIGAETLAVAGEDEIKALAEGGKLRPEHYVFDPAANQWMYARELRFLESAFSTRIDRANPDAWLVQVAGRSFPLQDISTARAWIVNGRLTRTSLIRNPVLQKWMRAGDVLELSDAFDDTPPANSRVAPSPRRAGADHLILGIVVLVAAGIIAALAIYTRRPEEPQPRRSTATSASGVIAPSTASPKIYDYTLGVKTEKISIGTPTPETAAVTSAASQTILTATAATAAATTAPPEAPVAKEPARPRREMAVIDDAEAELLNEEGDVVFKGTDSVRAAPSGDFRVYIDRNQRDSRYHLSSCTYFSSDMSAVSLDLARHGYKPCPICKPPQ